MSSSVSSFRRIWVVSLATALIGGAAAGWAMGFFTILPALHRVEGLVQQANTNQPTVPATSTQPVEIIPVEAPPDLYLGLPASLRVGRASPVLPLFRVDARASEDLFFSSEQLTSVVALTNDGWLVTTESALPTTLRLADVAIGWKGKLLTPTKGVRDRATGLVFFKIEVRDLPAAALVSRFDVELGQPAWSEQLANKYLPTTVARLDFTTTSSLPMTSDQWNRRFFLSSLPMMGTSAVWDARGQLIGLAFATSSGVTVTPTDPIRSGLTSLLAEGTIRRPTLGVHYVDLSTSFMRSTETTLTDKGALLRGDRRTISAVTANSPASQLLREGDIIERVDQDILDGSWTLAERVLEYRPGASVVLAGLRQGKPFEARVTFGSTVTSEALK